MHLDYQNVNKDRRQKFQLFILLKFNYKRIFLIIIKYFLLERNTLIEYYITNAKSGIFFTLVRHIFERGVIQVR